MTTITDPKLGTLTFRVVCSSSSCTLPDGRRLSWTFDGQSYDTHIDGRLVASCPSEKASDAADRLLFFGSELAEPVGAPETPGTRESEIGA